MHNLELFYRTNDFNKGHLFIDLDQLFPGTIENLKRLFSFIDMTEEPEKNAAAVYEYILEKYEELKKERAVSVNEKYNKRLETDMKKYVSLSKQFSKYDIDPINDNAEKISFKKAMVYAIKKHGERLDIEVYAGYTFTKAGIQFDLYKTVGNEEYYTVLLTGTGWKISGGHDRAEALNAINDKVIEILKDPKTAPTLEHYRELFRSAMIAAGYIDPVQEPETIQPEEVQEENKTEDKTMYTFTKDTITCNEKTFPAEYKKSITGSVLVFAIVGTQPNGKKEKKKIVFEPTNEYYKAAAAAAGIETNTEKARIIEEEPTKEAAPDPVQAEEKEPVKDPEPVQEATPEPENKREPKAARGPVPEKTFIGSTINGNGWKIFFDPATQRTRIIFNDKPTKDAIKALENAGFYYSKVMDSWNKKLTFKAYRAATALTKELETIYAA